MREHGGIIVDGVQTGSTARCPHCGGHFQIASAGTLAEARKTMGEMARPRIHCVKCNRLTCGRESCDPAIHGCVPLEARLEHTEGTKTKYDDAIADMKAKGAHLL
jgi:hypothetical protein